MKVETCSFSVAVTILLENVENRSSKLLKRSFRSRFLDPRLPAHIYFICLSWSETTQLVVFQERVLSGPALLPGWNAKWLQGPGNIAEICQRSSATFPVAPGLTIGF